MWGGNKAPGYHKMEKGKKVIHGLTVDVVLNCLGTQACYVTSISNRPRARGTASGCEHL
jgi:hypothetical protein